MAIRAGQILHVAGGFVIDRIQTGGAGQLNIPQEKVYELGNYQSVGIVRDVPDLTFSLECLETDTEMEALLTGADPTAAAAGDKYELSKNLPIDIISPWKSPYGDFEAVRGVAVPALALESASYRYGLRENAGETFSLRGDSIYYVPGAPYQDQFTGDGTLTAFTLSAGPALTYTEGGSDYFALSVSVDGVRQFKGTDYTETATTVTFTTAPAAGAKISVVYGSATTDTYAQTVHQGVAVKPAAIRGKDIDVYFSTAIPGVDLGAGVGAAVEVRWPDVQSATIDWRVTLEDDYEFGNPRAVAREATDVPAVTGAIEVKARSVEAMFTRLQQISGVPAGKIIGPQSSIAGALRIVLRNPESGGTTVSPAGTVLKTHYMPAVRFTLPGYEGRVQQKLTQTLNYESDDGVLEIYKGAKP